jgi:hypothetical protein
MAIRAIQITRSPMCVRIDLQQLVSGTDPTHKLTRCGAPSTSAVGHSRLRWSRPRLVHVRFNPDSDRQPSKRDPALRANTGSRAGSREALRIKRK